MLLLRKHFLFFLIVFNLPIQGLLFLLDAPFLTLHVVTAFLEFLF